MAGAGRHLRRHLCGAGGHVHRQCGVAHLGARTQCHHNGVEVDRGRLQLVVCRTGARRRKFGRPLRPQNNADGRVGDLCHRQPGGHHHELSARAHGHASGDGRRRRAGVPSHAVDHHQRVHRSRRTGQSHWPVGCHDGPRCGLGSDHRRVGDRAGFVALDLCRGGSRGGGCLRAHRAASSAVIRRRHTAARCRWLWRRW
jgi:hypothetical protein